MLNPMLNVKLLNSKHLCTLMSGWKDKTCFKWAHTSTFFKTRHSSSTFQCLLKTAAEKDFRILIAMMRAAEWPVLNFRKADDIWFASIVDHKYKIKAFPYHGFIVWLSVFDTIRLGKNYVYKVVVAFPLLSYTQEKCHYIYWKNVLSLLYLAWSWGTRGCLCWVAMSGWTKQVC